MNTKLKYPKNEIIWVTHLDKDGNPIFFITSKIIRDVYYLYEVLSDFSYKKIKKSQSPIVLEQYMKNIIHTKLKNNETNN